MDRALNIEEAFLPASWAYSSFLWSDSFMFLVSKQDVKCVCMWTERRVFLAVFVAAGGLMAHVMKMKLYFCWPARTMCPHTSDLSLAWLIGLFFLPLFWWSFIKVRPFYACLCSSHIIELFCFPCTYSGHDWKSEQEMVWIPCSCHHVKVEGKPSLKALTAYVTASWMWCIIFRLIVLLRQRF